MGTAELVRDEHGRLLADDGWPLGGLATIREVIAATGIKKSKLYSMIGAGDLEAKHFGRSVRIPWRVVRHTFFGEAR